jgi:hypothetical protein
MNTKEVPPESSETAPVAVPESTREKRAVRKHNTEIGYKIHSGHLSLLSRKLINILLYYAQRLKGTEDAEGKYWVDGPQVIKDAKFNSRDYELLRESLDELQSVRIIRQTENGGVSSDVLIPSFTLDNAIHRGNEGKAVGQKKRGGRLVIGFSLPPHIKELLLSPRSNYTVLPIAYVANLRTIGGIVLYEIAKRYATNPSGVTNRESWQYWWRILTGAEEGATIPEYKYFKRDVLKRAVDEINAVTDMQISLLEHKEGRWVRELQFAVIEKRQTNLDMDPPPIDNAMLVRITSMGVTTAEAERLIQRHREEELSSALDLLNTRMANKALPAIAAPAAYFKSALKGDYAAGLRAKQQTTLAAREKAARAVAARESVLAVKSNTEASARAEQRAFFESLLPSDLAILQAEFAETLAGPLMKTYQKSGISSKLVQAAFETWLIGHRKGSMNLKFKV